MSMGGCTGKVMVGLRVGREGTQRGHGGMQWPPRWVPAPWLHCGALGAAARGAASWGRVPNVGTWLVAACPQMGSGRGCRAPHTEPPPSPCPGGAAEAGGRPGGGSLWAATQQPGTRTPLHPTGTPPPLTPPSCPSPPPRAGASPRLVAPHLLHIRIPEALRQRRAPLPAPPTCREGEQPTAQAEGVPAPLHPPLPLLPVLRPVNTGGCGCPGR